MTKVRQVIGANGLQIPLPIMERYGLKPGSQVVLELDEAGIHITLESPTQQDIENGALQYLLKNVGDAATVQVERENDKWRVAVFGAGIKEPLGHLIYGANGHLVEEESTSPKTMRETAVTAYETK